MGWDGKQKGQMAQSGAYIAIAEAIDYKGRPMKNVVNVILIR